MPEELEKYWEQFIAGNRNAFSPIYEHYRPLLSFYCVGILKDLSIAENFSSEALIKVFEHDHPSEIRNLERWLFSIAKNLCISHLRQLNTRGAILTKIGKAQSLKQEPEIELKQRSENIDQIIEQFLNESESELWKLHAAGYSNREISGKLNMNEKTVANRKSEIRNRLKKKVGDYLRNQEK